MPDILEDYFKALERLKNGRPERIPKGSKITNDAVSLEAGRKKGTIKKSRPIFEKLIAAINEASHDFSPQDMREEQLAQAKEEVKKYRKLWEEALVREVSLVKQLWSERGEWAEEKAALTSEKVSSIRSRQLEEKGRGSS